MGCNCKNKKRTTWTYRQAQRAAAGNSEPTTDNADAVLAETAAIVTAAAAKTNSKTAG